MSRPHKATGLLKSPVRSPPSSANGRVEHDRCQHRNARAKPCIEQALVVLDSHRVSILYSCIAPARFLNTTTGYSNSGSMGPDFEIDEPGLIGARPRLGGGAELLARRPRAARHAQRAR
eukprot:5031558-Prymnesium_polylepis.1